MPEQRYIAIDEGEYVRIVPVKVINLEHKESMEGEIFNIMDEMSIFFLILILIGSLFYRITYNMTHLLDR